MKGVGIMKKFLIPIILALCAVMLVGCKRLELPVAGTVEITEYGTSGEIEVLNKITVRDAEQVKYICQNLNSLTLKKIRRGEMTELKYRLVIYNSAGMKVKTVNITFDGHIDYGDGYYFVKKGELDFDYIKSLLLVTAQNKNEKYSYSSAVVSSGMSGIQPIETLAYMNEYTIDGEGLLCADGMGCYEIFGDPETKLSELPTLVSRGEITVTAPEHSKIGGVQIYDTNFELFESHSGFKGLHHLPAGEYVVVFFENTDSRKIKNETETYWLSQYENVFRLIIPERAIGQTAHSLVFNDTCAVTDDFYLTAKYRAGERVKIKLHSATEQYYRVYVNGEEMSLIKNDSDYFYTTFAFIMPEGGAEITIETVSVEIPSK